jgi:hypothetical protein
LSMRESSAGSRSRNPASKKGQRIVFRNWISCL